MSFELTIRFGRFLPTVSTVCLTVVCCLQVRDFSSGEETGAQTTVPKYVISRSHQTAWQRMVQHAVKQEKSESAVQMFFGHFETCSTKVAEVRRVHLLSDGIGTISLHKFYF